MPGFDRRIRRFLPSWRRKVAAGGGAATPNTVSIFDVAEEVFELETCGAVAAVFPDAIRHAGERNPFLNWSAPAATLRGYRLRDVVLDRSLMVLLKDGRVIAETNYLQSPANLAAVQVRPDSLVRPDFSGVVATCCDHWDANYYHWLAHTAPAVQAIRQRHPAGEIGLVVPQLSHWQETSLAMLGASSLPRFATELGAQYHFAEMEYYDYVAGRADYSVSALSRRAYAGMSAGIKPAAGSPRRLYIDRTGTTNRRIPNEADLIAALRGRGVHIVRPETLRLDEQVALFRGAGLVIGQMGAGLANIAFCAPGAVVYELLPEHHQNPCFLAMCLQGELCYWADVFPTGICGDSHTSNWLQDIDIAQVLRRLDELESLMPPDRCN
jgi:hypothetical protein